MCHGLAVRMLMERGRREGQKDGGGVEGREGLHLPAAGGLPGELRCPVYCTSKLAFLPVHTCLLLQVSPEDYAVQFVSDVGGFSDVESVLRGIVLMAAAEIAAEPAVRASVRESFWVSAASLL